MTSLRQSERRSDDALLAEAARLHLAWLTFRVSTIDFRSALDKVIVEWELGRD